MEAIHLGRAVINIQALWVIGTTMLMAIGLFLFFEYSAPKKKLDKFLGS